MQASSPAFSLQKALLAFRNLNNACYVNQMWASLSLASAGYYARRT